MPDLNVLHQMQRVGIVLDTGLLLLLVVGNASPERIGSERTKDYTAHDFTLLDRLVGTSRSVHVSPNVLTEVDNFLKRGKAVGTMDGQRVFRSLVQTRLEEKYESSSLLMADQTYLRLGLADCSIDKLADQGHVVVTNDSKLNNELQRRGRYSLHWETVRSWSPEKV